MSRWFPFWQRWRAQAPTERELSAKLDASERKVDELQATVDGLRADLARFHDEAGLTGPPPWRPHLRLAPAPLLLASALRKARWAHVAMGTALASAVAMGTALAPGVLPHSRPTLPPRPLTAPHRTRRGRGTAPGHGHYWAPPGGHVVSRARPGRVHATSAPSPVPQRPPPPRPEPSPRPSPVPSPHRSGTCVRILGVRVCVGHRLRVKGGGKLLLG